MPTPSRFQPLKPTLIYPAIKFWFPYRHVNPFRANKSNGKESTDIKNFLISFAPENRAGIYAQVHLYLWIGRIVRGFGVFFTGKRRNAKIHIQPGTGQGL